MKKITPSVLLSKKKKGEKIVALTSYDAPMAAIAEQMGVDLLLVGDSVGMVQLGYDSTLPVTMEEMLHHTRAVVRGARNAFVVSDMPFMSYQTSVQDEEAVRNAGRFIKEAGAKAVKIEGGVEMAPLIKKMADLGIPVLGHIGLKPQHFLKKGNYHIAGTTKEEQAKLLEDARAVEAAGAFGIVLEAMPAECAKQISIALKIPTIGIGAGPECDGQILVLNDLIGLNGGKTPKFVKAYANLYPQIVQAVQTYAKEVREGTFPDAGYSY